MSSPQAPADSGAPVSLRANKKTNHACRRCRERKVKCSSEHPCRACTNRNEPCVFESEEKKVTVSERYDTRIHLLLLSSLTLPGSYLAELKRRAGEDGELPRPKRTCELRLNAMPISPVPGYSD